MGEPCDVDEVVAVEVAVGDFAWVLCAGNECVGGGVELVVAVGVDDA